MANPTYDKDITGLLVIDPYNDFISEGGKGVEATVRYAAELGYEVTVVKDATASYSDREMRAALEVNTLSPLCRKPATSLHDPATGPGPSEFQASLERDHSRRTVAAQPHTQQAGRRRGRIRQGAEARLGRHLAGDPGINHGWQSEVRVIEKVEKLGVEPQLHLLGERKPLGQVEIAPHEVRAAQSIATEISELTMRRGVTVRACPGARIDGGTKSLRIQPLNGTRLGHARNRSVLV